MASLSSIHVALAQINPIVGDLPGNAARIQMFYEKAAKQEADLVVCPELVLTGYPPEDLILQHAFRDRAMLALQELAGKTATGPALLLGTVWEDKDGIFNAAVLIDGGRIAQIQPKTMLPNYGVFDEKRLFSAAHAPAVFAWRGVRVGVLICEDVWAPDLSHALSRQDVELMLVINASPFESDKLRQRKQVAAESVRITGAPLVYVNMAGGQDDIVFDGGSFALNPDGALAAQLPEFAEALEVVTLTKKKNQWLIHPAAPRPPLPYEDALWQAMVLGLHDYAGKNGFSGVVLGLSGGIDSAFTAAVAVEALGAENVHGVLLPSPYTSDESVEDAQESARLLGIETTTLPITPGMQVLDHMLSPMFKDAGWMEDVAVGGNLQARLRGLALMSVSNKFGWMLLSTGNKSEISVGYTTLYGDSCGGYNVLKDLYKTQVYQLARWRNGKGSVIPERSITKAPSAELAPGQKDEDQLPPYAVLDGILLRHIEGRMSVEEIVAEGFDSQLVFRVVRMVRNSEYKRRQSCPGVKLSPMLYGRDRRFPLTNKF